MIEILTVLNNVGYGELRDFGDTWRTNPLYRAYRSQNSLAIKKSTGQWFDHSERTGGSLAQLVQKTLNLPSLDETKSYMGNIPILYDTRESTELTEVKKFDRVLLTKLQKDNSYWHNRGISDGTLTAFEGGVAITKGRLKGRYVFPIFDDTGNIIGFAGRLLYQSDLLPKWKLIGSKKQWIFPHNLSEIIDKKSVIIVESIGDALSLLEIGIRNILVMFGVSLSPEIIKVLLKCDVNKISILLNNDNDNGFVGNQASEAAKNDLLSFFDPNQIKIITPPENDLNDIIMTGKEKLKDFSSKMELYI